MIHTLKKIIGLCVNAVLSHPRVRFSFFGALYENALNEREKMLYRAMKYARASKLAGDYFEFGVWRGNTVTAAFHIAKRYLPKISFYAFDSFAGLPLPKEKDAAGFHPFDAGQFACDEKTFRENLRKRHVDLSRVHVVAGWYKDTLNDRTKEKLSAKHAAIVYIDCDLYESARDVLEFVTSYLEDGSLILFDEWFSYRGRADRGERRAFAEWLAQHPELTATEYHKFTWSGNSFVINLRRSL